MRPADEKLLAKLKKFATECGVKVIKRGNGHIQLQGECLLVNYYPFSAGRTAYVAGTTAGVKNCDIYKAVAMARTAPAVVPKVEQAKRDTATRKIRYAMLKGRIEVKCCWCPTMIDINTSTLEHIIPLGRGGLDNPNNRALACAPCNKDRANNMPELKQWPAPNETSPPWEVT